jgi:hypothetical protein
MPLKPCGQQDVAWSAAACMVLSDATLAKLADSKRWREGDFQVQGGVRDERRGLRDRTGAQVTW